MNPAPDRYGVDEVSLNEGSDDVAHIIGAQPDAGVQVASAALNPDGGAWLVERFEHSLALVKADPPVERPVRALRRDTRALVDPAASRAGIEAVDAAAVSQAAHEFHRRVEGVLEVCTELSHGEWSREEFERAACSRRCPS
jgi:hypothetical protein